MTGDLHIAIYDLTTMTVHIANARRDGAAPLVANKYHIHYYFFLYIITF